LNSEIDQILDLIKKYQRILLSNKRLKVLEKEIIYENENLKKLEIIYLKEHKDIVNLEKLSIRSVFNKVLKNDIEQLEKEKQEYLVAVLAYNESVKLIKMIEFEIDQLKNVVQDEEVVLKTLNSSLKIFNHEHLFSESPYLAELKIINNEITNLVRIKIEAEEALDATQILQSTFQDLIENINRAQSNNNWGKFYSEIQQAREEKRSFIDKANNTIPIIKKLLHLLNSELTDIQEFQDFFKSSEILVRGFNIEFYKDLIEDWINDDNLIQTLTTTLSLNSHILRLLKSLKHLADNTEVELPHAIAKRNKIIENIN